MLRKWAALLLPPSDKPGAGRRYTPAEIRAAIAAKAKSLRGADRDEVEYKLGLRRRAATFPARLDYWLDIAGVVPECDRAPAIQDCRLLHDRLDEICGSRPRPSSSGPLPQRAPDAVVIDLETGAAEVGSDDARRRLRLLASHVAAAAGDADWYTKVWAALPDRRRQLVNHALARDWRDYVRAFDRRTDPADVRLDPLWLEPIPKRLESVRRAFETREIPGIHERASGSPYRP